MSRSNPFDDVERLFEQLTHQFEAFDPAGELGGGISVDVADLGDRYEVTADIPGFESDDIEVTLPDAQTVRIDATHADETATHAGDESRQFVRRERRRESVSRSVSLPQAVDEEGATATVENGVLTVALPKSAGDGGTDVPVS
jgi:HSP20 family protein